MPNVFEIIEAAEIGIEGHGYPIFLRRDSWGPRTVFCVCGTYPDFKEWELLGPRPYYNSRESSWRHPMVYGVAHWQSMSKPFAGMRPRRGQPRMDGGGSCGYAPHVLDGPGTGAYTRIARPVWWDAPRVQTWIDLAAGGFKDAGRATFCLNYGG